MHHSRPDHWLQPRPYSDPTLRQMKHGRILPMEYPRSTPRWRAALQGVALTLTFFAIIFFAAVMTP